MKKNMLVRMIAVILCAACLPVMAGAAAEAGGDGEAVLLDKLRTVRDFKFQNHSKGIGTGTCAVYSAPSNSSYRAANGRAACDLAAEVDESGFIPGWLLVRYKTAAGKMRVGYIRREKTGDFKGAINDYTAVLEDYPNFWTGYENRAKCYRLAGMNKQALADERKVYIARLDDMFGTAKRNRQKPTRKQKEQDIDDYKKMVVENDDENIAKFYASDYRGRIQNRDVVIEQQPLYLLTFTPRENGLTARLSYAQFLEQFNNSRVLSRPLYLAPHEEALDADGIRSVDEEARQLANRLSHQQRDTRLLFAHAFCTSSKRDYTAAIDDLNQALSLDSTFVAALFLRAVVREKQLETYRSKQHKETGLQSEDMRMDYRPVIADLSNAIRQEPACAFFYYNRGCIYSRIKADDEARRDYDKAIQLNPSLAEAYYNRGLLLVGQQNYQDGFADLSKAGELGIYSAYSLIKHFRRVQQGKK